MTNAESFDSRYANVYDLLHKGKNYTAETDLILSECKQAGLEVNSVLDVACGTGNHVVEFIKRGLLVQANDLSSAMIDAAAAKLQPSEKKINFFNVPMQNLQQRVGTPSDLVVALYTAVGYLVDSHDLNKFLQSLKTLVRPGGLFFADFWNGRKISTEYSPSRVKSYSDDFIQINRISTVTSIPKENALEVRFDFTVDDLKESKKFSFKEVHRVRYHTVCEIKSLLQAHGFEVIKAGPFFDEANVPWEAWNFYILARNNNE